MPVMKFGFHAGEVEVGAADLVFVLGRPSRRGLASIGDAAQCDRVAAQEVEFFFRAVEVRDSRRMELATLLVVQ